jgi:hypothetical protein
MGCEDINEVQMVHHAAMDLVETRTNIRFYKMKTFRCHSNVSFLKKILYHVTKCIDIKINERIIA